MNEEVWYKIMEEYIKSYEAIMWLNEKGILTDDDFVPAMLKLIEDVIITFRSEVEN